MSLYYKQDAVTRYFINPATGEVYEAGGASVFLLCWRNGEKVRVKMVELPPGLDELWGSSEAQAWSFVRPDECKPVWNGNN